MLKRSLLLAFLFSSTATLADPPVINEAKAERDGALWRFDVTLTHGDTGWDHYADGWRILGPDGAELGLRNLVHPHVNEQPFTRSLSGVAIPEGVNEVTIQARDNLTGWGPETKTVKLR